MADQFFCPHCYKQISRHELLYFKPSCGEKQPAPAPGLLQKIGISLQTTCVQCSKQNKPNCKTCDRQLHFRACPICKGCIPPASVTGNPVIIAVAGESGSGKSQFIKAIITQLRQMSEVFSWTITQFNADSAKNKIFILRKNNRSKGCMVVLTEAGESELTPALMGALSGVIFTIDPLQVSDAREELSAQGKSLPTQFDSDPMHLINRVRLKNVSIPTAFTLTKIDTLISSDATYSGRWMFKSDERLLCRDNSHRGKLLREELETISCEVESWLGSAYPQMFKPNNMFTNSMCFGCSSIEPRLHVEDALLWILAQNKQFSLA